MGLTINSEIVASAKRNEVMAAIEEKAAAFGASTQTEVKISGLPYIRTMVGLMIQDEMRWFLVGSLLLSALILLLFFRSISAMLLSLAVVLMGVVWSLGTMDVFGYKISLLTALIPPLIVVIGIPNCIYFLNKYHTSYRATGGKKQALVQSWVLYRRRYIYVFTTLLLLVSIAGIFNLKSEGFIVDDLPRKDKIYTDLKFFCISENLLFSYSLICQLIIN